MSSCRRVKACERALRDRRSALKDAAIEYGRHPVSKGLALEHAALDFAAALEELRVAEAALPAPAARYRPDTRKARCMGGCGASKDELIVNGHRPGCKLGEPVIFALPPPNRAIVPALIPPPATAAMSSRVFTLDGSEHGPEICAGERFCTEKVCVPCGVYMHFQAVYGGQFWQCPECEAIS